MTAEVQEDDDNMDRATYSNFPRGTVYFQRCFEMNPDRYSCSIVLNGCRGNGCTSYKCKDL